MLSTWFGDIALYVPLHCFSLKNFGSFVGNLCFKIVCEGISCMLCILLLLFFFPKKEERQVNVFSFWDFFALILLCTMVLAFLIHRCMSVIPQCFKDVSCLPNHVCLLFERVWNNL